MSQTKLVPNLLYNSTYALNYSYSKFVYVGLDYAAGYFRPVIRFGGHTSPHKYITLDIDSWEQLKTHFKTFGEYLWASGDFVKQGKYAKIYLPHHDVELTTAYGHRTVSITDKPEVTPPSFTLQYEHEAQQFDFEDDNANQEAAASTTSDEPTTKKKKSEKPPKIMMQYTTFNGLKQFQQCIDYKLKKLEEMSGFVNKVFGIMIDVIKTEAISKNDVHLLDHTFIGVVFNELEDKMKELALNQLMFANFSESSLEIMFLEVYAEYLTILEKNVVSALKV